MIKEAKNTRENPAQPVVTETIIQQSVRNFAFKKKDASFTVNGRMVLSVLS